MDNVVIFAADIGSVKKRNFGWAMRRAPDAGKGHERGDDPRSLVEAAAEEMRSGRPVALGFECPQWVELPDDPEDLTQARDSEGNRAWSAGAGAGALATGVAETAWILRELRARIPDLPGFIEWAPLESAGLGLFVWEAFVSGTPKETTHQGAARMAVDAFARALPDPGGSNAINPRGEVHSLIGAALLRTGWSTDVSVLSKPCLVIRGSGR